VALLKFCLLASSGSISKIFFGQAICKSKFKIIDACIKETNTLFISPHQTINRSEIENKIAKLSEYLELKIPSFISFIDCVLDLRDKIKIPHKLSECAKITDKDIEKLSPMALNDPCTPENPKKTTLNDMKSMYQHSIEGKLFN